MNPYQPWQPCPEEHTSSPVHRSENHHNQSEGSMTPVGQKRVEFTPDITAANRTPEDTSPDNTPLGRADVSHEELAQSVHMALAPLYTGNVPASQDVQKPRPAIRKTPRTSPQFPLEQELGGFDESKKRSGLEAQQRALQLSKNVGTYSASAPGSRRNSNDTLITRPSTERLRASSRSRQADNESPATTDDEEDAEPEHMKHAKLLVRQHTVGARAPTTIRSEDLYHHEPIASGHVTPENEVEIENEYVSRPTKFRTGVLGTLLRANAAHGSSGVASRSHKATGHGRNHSQGSLPLSTSSTAQISPISTPPVSGTSTPRRSWYTRHGDHSVSSISNLVGSSSMLATPGGSSMSHEIEEQYKKVRPGLGTRKTSDNSITSALKTLGGKARRTDEYKIKIHLAGTLARQSYLRKLCKALMMYGAPTHRLEEYLSMSARVLEIEAQFLYMPGCMIIAFDDSSIHTSEVKLVRTSQGVDLGKLRDVHEIYKDVVHDRMGVEEATPLLEAIISRKSKFSSWLRVPVYGLASASVGPFAFQARPIDLPFCFLLGCLLGWLQLIVAPGNELITNVFEIGAAVITSFLARGLGSIRDKNGDPLFCFSAMAQSSIALILPGFTVLSASLELQSRHIVAGSVRMVYAIIYSLFLGFGITIGTVLFGMMYKDATSQTTCKNPMASQWYYLFVLGFAICLMVINQAKVKQMPAMALISLIGYAVNYNSAQFFKNNAQVSNTLGALAIGIAANLHARFGRHVENWSLDMWEQKLRPRWIRLRKAVHRCLRPLRARRTTPTHQHAHDELKQDYTHHHYFSNSTPNSASHTRASSTTTLTPDATSPSSSPPYAPYTHHHKIGYGLAAAAMLPAIFVQVPSGLSVQGSLISGLTSADQIVRNTTINGTATVTSPTDPGSSVNSVALNVGFSVIQIAIGITVGLFLAALLVYPLGKRRSGLFSF